MRVLLYALPLVLLVLLAAVFATRLTGDVDPQRVQSPLIDRPAPRTAIPALLPTVPGVSAADLAQGKPVLVNFFASWCGPCQVEHPVLMQLSKSGVPVIGVAWKDEPAASRRFLAALGNPYSRLGQDPDNRIGPDWGVYGVPETFLVDGAGVVRQKWTRAITPELLESEVMPGLRAAAAGAGGAQ